MQWLSIIFLCLCAPVLAHEAGNLPFANTYGLYDTPSLGTPGNWDTTGKFSIPSSVINGTTGVFVTIGQSRISNQSSSPATQYVPTNSVKCLNLNPYDGQIYKLIDPVLGASVVASNSLFSIGWHGQLCDKLINAGKYTQVLLLPIAQSGSSVTDWISSGFANIRLTVAASWLTSLGLTLNGWLWQQGTTDCISGMSQNTYQTNLRSVISYERALSGRSSDKWMIAQDSVKDGAGTTCSAIRAGQASVAGDSNNILGPDIDSLPTTDYDAGPHFNNTGNDAAAGLWSTKIQANF